MKLVIAEKPSVAQSLSAVIGATARKDGYLEGNGWRVSWCVGHLAGLADADSYDKNARQAFYQKVFYPDNSYEFKEGSTFVPHFISTDGKYLIDYEIPENGNNPVVVLVER